MGSFPQRQVKIVMRMGGREYRAEQGGEEGGEEGRGPVKAKLCLLLYFLLPGCSEVVRWIHLKLLSNTAVSIE